MLEDFFEFVALHKEGSYWLHWNMRDLNYGFAAIEHRFRVLGGEPIIILDDRKYDLARILIARYGERYAERPRLDNIIDINKIPQKALLTGKNEACGFEDRLFLKLHQSTLRKVGIISNIAERSADGSLKTLAPFWDRHGGSIRLVWDKYVHTPVGITTSIALTVLALVEWVSPDAKIHLSEFMHSLFQRHNAICNSGPLFYSLD